MMNFVVAHCIGNLDKNSPSLGEHFGYDQNFLFPLQIKKYYLSLASTIVLDGFISILAYMSDTEF